MTPRSRSFVGGRLVTPGGMVDGTLVVDEGRIVALGEVDPVGEVVDVGGLVVMPGGVDSHIHLMDPGPTDREDFPTGTRAAAARGVTTIIEHTHAHPITDVSGLAEKVNHLRGRSNVDFGLAAHIWPDRIDHIAALWEAGISFFKGFTCTTHGVPGLDAHHLMAALDEISRVGGRALLHCEDESLTAAAERLLREERGADPATLIEWRSRSAELVALAAAGVLAQASGARVTMAHVSHPEAVEIIVDARRRGADIAAEACPQYFALQEDEVRTKGALRKFTPPARLRTSDDAHAMWSAVKSGGFSHFSTDHAPSTLDQKLAGDIWEAPFGLPGIDTTYPFLIDAAITGTLDFPAVARLYCQAPARRYGLAPFKGSIEVGADADLALIDPMAEWVVTDDDIISKARWSPYSGRRFRGWVVATYLRGDEIASDGDAHDLRSGRFVATPRPSPTTG